MNILLQLYCILFLLTLLYSGCTVKIDQYDIEIIVYKELFRQLADSVIQFPVYPPPPPPDTVFSEGRIKENLEGQKYYKELLSKINSNRFVVSINDSTNIGIDSSCIIDKFRDCSLKAYLGALNEYKLNHKKDILFAIDSVKKVGKFECVRFSELQKLTNNGEPKYGFYYFGNLTLSRIYFDKEFKNGFLIVEIFCGRECHSRYLVLISNETKWRINKFVLLSIS